MRLIGEILCKIAGLTQAQIKQALQEQNQSEKGRPLGQILLKKGYITEEQLNEALVIQKRLRDKDRVLQR